MSFTSMTGPRHLWNRREHKICLLPIHRHWLCRTKRGTWTVSVWLFIADMQLDRPILKA
jgi:hypothetical protein